MRIFTIRNRTNIVIRLNIRFRTLRIGRGLATRGSHDCNVNESLFRIARIEIYNNPS